LKILLAQISGDPPAHPPDRLSTGAADPVRDRGEAPLPGIMGYHWKEALEIGFTERRTMERQIKIIVEKHADGYVAYPLSLKGVVVGQGDTYEDALKDVKSAIRFHVETFGPDVLEQESPVIEAFVAEAGIAV
jgi:predicted RNase H-like HicB family nuclease